MFSMRFKSFILSIVMHIIFLFIFVFAISKIYDIPIIKNSKIQKTIEKYEIKNIKPRRYKKIKNKNIHALAKCVYFEARNQSRKGQLAVISVVLERVKSKNYPDNIYDVVYQPHQFSWTDSSKKINNTDLYLSIYNLCSLVLKGKIKFKSIKATNYYADYIAPPYWTKKMTYIAKIQNHIFYR